MDSLYKQTDLHKHTGSQLTDGSTSEKGPELLHLRCGINGVAEGEPIYTVFRSQKLYDLYLMLQTPHPGQSI